MRFSSVFVIPLTGIALSSLAQPPHVGTWAIDYAKSDGGEQVWEFANLGSGLWEFKADGRRIFRFRMDDNECANCATPGPWELVGPETYLTNFVSPSGARDVVKIAADGGSLSFMQKRPGATGELEDHVGTFQRFSGGPGLAGIWRVETEQNLSPPLVALSRGVGEWFVFKWTRMSGVAGEDVLCVLLLDDADHPCFGALLAPGWTIAMKLIDARTLEAVVKVNGVTDAESVFTVSPDGESMTQTQRSITGGSLKTVYNRRSPTAD